MSCNCDVEHIDLPVVGMTLSVQKTAMPSGGGTKAFVRVSAASPITVLASKNLTEVVRLGAGRYKATFSVDISKSAVLASASTAQVLLDTITANSVEFRLTNSAGDYMDGLFSLVVVE